MAYMSFEDAAIGSKLTKAVTELATKQTPAVAVPAVALAAVVLAEAAELTREDLIDLVSQQWIALIALREGRPQ